MTQTLWTFRTKRFQVSLNWDYDVDFDISFDDTNETAEKLESGEWTCAMFHVSVALDGIELGSSYLGNSIYADLADFRDHIGMNARGHGSYFSDMVREAVAEARAHLCQAPRLRCAA
jgi:hypothetical protein